MKKNIVALILTIFLILLSVIFVGCANNNSANNAEDQDNQTQMPIEPEDDEDEENKQYKISFITTYVALNTGKVTQTGVVVEDLVVIYGEEFVLQDLGIIKVNKIHEYVFLHWVKAGTNEKVESGIYLTEGDLVLQAVWKYSIVL